MSMLPVWLDIQESTPDAEFVPDFSSGEASKVEECFRVQHAHVPTLTGMLARMSVEVLHHIGVFCGAVSLAPLRTADSMHNYIFHAGRFRPTWHRTNDRRVRQRVDCYDMLDGDKGNWWMFWRPDEIDEENYFRALDLVAFDGEPKLANSAADDLFLAFRRKEYETAVQHADRIWVCFENFHILFQGTLQLDFLAKQCCLPLSVARVVFPNHVWQLEEDESKRECRLQSIHVAVLVGDVWIANLLLTAASYSYDAIPHPGTKEARLEYYTQHVFFNKHTPSTNLAGTCSALFFALLVAPDKHLDAWLSLLISKGARLSNMDSYTAGNIVAHDDVACGRCCILEYHARLNKVLSLLGIPDDQLEHAVRSFEDDAYNEDYPEAYRRELHAGVDTSLYTWLKETHQVTAA